MGLDGAFADAESPADVLVRQALRHKPEHFEFARGWHGRREVV